MRPAAPTPIRLVAGLIAAAVSLTLLWATPAGAQDDDEPVPSFSGTLVFEDQPVGGVEISVTEIDGDIAETTTTDAEGNWRIEVPNRGADYRVSLNVDTLPDGVTLRQADGDTLQISISQPGQQRRPNFFLGEGENRGISEFEKFAQALVNGIKIGLIIAMSAVGLSLIFGTTGLINFSHGELVTFGAVLAFWLNTESADLTLILAAALTVVAAIGLGVGLESGVMRPLRARKIGPFQFVVVTIGLSLMGRQLFQMWIGGLPQSYRNYTIQKPWDLGLFDLTPRDFTIIVLSILSLVGVATWLQTTRSGKAMRAVSDNPDLAASSGIAVNRVTLTVWGVGAGLAALGGVFLGLSEAVQFDMGFRFLLLMFSAIILGGLGTAYGAMAGGLLIGVVTEVSTVWFQPELKFVWALLALIVALIVRPQGLLGVKERIG